MSAGFLKGRIPPTPLHNSTAP